MQFLADMGIALRIVEWLRKAGHDARHLREEGLHRLPNGDIFAKALQEGRILLTFDLDFAEIVALSGEQSVSVIVFRLHNTTTPQHRMSSSDWRTCCKSPPERSKKVPSLP